MTAVSTPASRILIVDDEPAHVEAIRRALLSSEAKMDIRVADSLRGYQEAVATRAPDLVLLDYLLPDGRADSVLVSPPETGPFPIVLMTSHGDEQVAVRAIQQGALDYIVKSEEAFAGMPYAVNRVLRAWRLLMERKETQRTLEAEATRRRILIEGSRDGIVVLDQGGKVVEANRRFAEMLGYSAEEILGLHVWDWEAQITREQLEEMIHKVGPAGDHFEAVHRRKDGSTYPVEISSNATELGGQKLIFCVCRDITERKRAETQLRHTNTLLHDMGRLAKVGGWEFDVATGEGTWTEEVARIHDLSPEMPSNKALGLSFYRGESRERIEAAIARAIAQGEPYDLELELVSATGNHKVVHTIGEPVWENARIVKMRGAIKDITERRQAEELNRVQHSLTAELAASNNLVAALDMCLQKALEATGLDAGGFYLLNERTGALQLAAHRGLSAGFVAEVMHFNADSSQAHLVKAGKPVFARFDEYNLKRSEAEVEEGLCLLAVIPLWHEGRIIGCLNAASHTQDDLSPTLRQGLETIAASTAQAVVRLQAETAQREGEERLRLALEAARMGTFDADLVANQVTWSRRHQEIWGQPLDKLTGEADAFLRQVHPEDRAGIQAVWERCVASRLPFQHEYRVVWPDGTVHWVEAAGEFTFDADGRPIRLRGTVVETTQRRQAERFHALSAEVLSLLNQETPGTRTTQRILDAIKRETGFDAVGVRLREGNDFPYQGSSGFTADFIAAENSLLVRTREGGLCRDEHGNVRLECTCGLIISGKSDPANPLFTPGGSAWTNDARSFLHVPASEDPRLNPRNRCIHEGFQSVALIPIRVKQEIIGLLQLNDRRQNCFTLQTIQFFEGLAASFGVALLRQREEQELRQLSLAVEQSPASIVITDLQGTIEYANRKFAQVTGYTLEEARGQNPRVLKSGETPPEVYATLWKTILAGKEWQGEFRNRRKNGELFWELASISPITNAAGHLTHFVAVKEDITERKRLEAFREALLALGEQLNHTRSSLDAGRALLRAADHLWQWDAATLNLITEDRTQNISLLSVDTVQGKRQELPTDPVGVLTPRTQRVLREGAFLILRGDLSQAVADSTRFGDTKRLSASIMCVPVRREAEIVGVLSIQSYVPKAYSQNDLQTLQALADYCGGVLARIHSEEALGRSEERYRHLVETTFDWIWEVDAEGRYTYASPQVANLLGYRPDEVQGRTPFDLMPESEAQRLGQIFRGIVAKREPFAALENINRRKDGRLVVLETSGVPVVGPQGELRGYRGMDRDVTARKQAELALKESEERFRRVVETAPEAIFIRTGLHFVYLNAAALKLFGATTPEQLHGKSVLERFHADCQEDIRARIQRLDEAGELTTTAEQVWLRLDGTPVNVIVSAVVFSYQGQRSALVFARDVTGYKRLESQLRQAQKLEAIGQLAGGVAHDFNNILAAIMMHLGLLQMNPALSEDTRHSLKELDEEARRAASLTRQLLMFSRRSVLTVKPLDLNEVIANLLKMLRRLIGEHIQLRFDDKTGLPPVPADAGMLEQVLMNLVVNARDAMPKGGRISIGTALVQLSEPEVALNAARQVGPFACLSVSDTGCGMDDETLKRVFEPFFTTKEAGKGTGLGLATVHGIVAQHKGWVEVESRVGQGTTFRIFLPVVADAVVQAVQSEPAAPLRRGHETILVVEDDLKVQQTVTQALRILGYRVYAAANGQEAMKIWLAHGAEVNLLLTDMVMPEGMTGLELVERLQAARPGLKAIISSGYSAEIVQAGVPDKAGVVYLPKPYQAQTLAEVVRDCLDQKTDREI